MDNLEGVFSQENTPDGHTEIHKRLLFPYKQISGRNGDHEWLRMTTNAFILCDLIWKVQKSHAVNREGSHNHKQSGELWGQQEVGKWQHQKVEVLCTVSTRVLYDLSPLLDHFVDYSYSESLLNIAFVSQDGNIIPWPLLLGGYSCNLLRWYSCNLLGLCRSNLLSYIGTIY